MRVIAGRLGGRRLSAPHGHGTRPTSDRVREALFSVLVDVGDARVLDLYAGTGALGIEALSRGALHATFVENARPALAALRENLVALGLAAPGSAVTRVVAQPVTRAAASLEGPFDLVFADPPYADVGDVVGAVAALRARGALAPGARIVVEHASRDPAPPLDGMTARPGRAYGDTMVTIYDGLAAPSEDSAPS
jgi:16S rRNA (guanine966-N2)-methyltransferase